MEVVKVYEDKFQNLMQFEPRLLEYVDSTESAMSVANKTEFSSPEPDPSVHRSFGCSCCKVQFTNVPEQRQHYKLDWHRYNLRRKLKGQSSVTEAQFEEFTEVSSISGSESDSEDNLENKSSTYVGFNRGRICIASSDGHVFSIYRCLLAEKKQEIVNVKESLYTLKNDMWFVILLGGGHFAAAIFDGAKVLHHKTFHCYTVRAGQGGAQSSRDSRGGAARSAGASLRRYNEQALATHVATILEAWKVEIAKCSLIPFRAAGTYNKNILFGGKHPMLHRNDKRLRVIPFATRRATFKEVKRVQDILASVKVYDSIESLQKYISTPDEKGEGKRGKTRGPAINRAKSRETIVRPLPFAMVSDTDDDTPATGDEEVVELMESLEINFNEELQPFADSLTPAERRRKTRKPKSSEKMKLHTERQAKIKAEKERVKVERQLTANLYQSIQTSNVATLVELLKRDASAVNLPLDADGNTPLHICAEQKRYDLVEVLLQHDADVCAKNVRNQTPYAWTQDKQVREIFKRFAEDNPEKHNYNRAQIPLLPKLTAEDVALKKLRAQQSKKAKRERAKEARRQRIVSAEEEEERLRFAKLSDREKHALAAERRILSANGSITSRCFECGDDMCGRVPYQYSNNQFCSIDCLKSHRIKHPVDLPY